MKYLLTHLLGVKDGANWCFILVVAPFAYLALC